MLNVILNFDFLEYNSFTQSYWVGNGPTSTECSLHLKLSAILNILNKGRGADEIPRHIRIKDLVSGQCIFNIFPLPTISGNGTITCLSNLPGLSNAGSNTSGLLVAAIIITPSFVSKPSISTRI